MTSLRRVLLVVIGLGWLVAIITQASLSGSRLVGVRPLPGANVVAAVVLVVGVAVAGGLITWFTRRWPLALLVPLHALLIYGALIVPWAL